MAIERFSREARLLARVSGEHVVRYVAHGVDAKGTPCLVVEWLDGEDLAARQRADPLSGAVLLDVARQIALGLDALHAEGIVHRDVKPSNVFLVPRAGETPCAKLIDLGVARARAESTLTTDGIAIGTPYYMSPEQARGDENITPASDLFSLGVLLFELASGTRPFRGDDLFAVLAKIVLAETPRLRDVAPSIPPEMVQRSSRGRWRRTRRRASRRRARWRRRSLPSRPSPRRWRRGSTKARRSRSPRASRAPSSSASSPASSRSCPSRTTTTAARGVRSFASPEQAGGAPYPLLGPNLRRGLRWSAIAGRRGPSGGARGALAGPGVARCAGRDRHRSRGHGW